jgi:hypothetical protein
MRRGISGDRSLASIVFQIRTIVSILVSQQVVLVIDVNQWREASGLRPY